MLNWLKKATPIKLSTKAKFSNYVLGVQVHQPELIKLLKKQNRLGSATFTVSLIPDENAEPSIVKVQIGRKFVGYLRNNVGYRYINEIGIQTTICDGKFQELQTQDDGVIAEVGVLLNCKTPFSISDSIDNRNKGKERYKVMNRLFQQSPIDNF